MPTSPSSSPSPAALDSSGLEALALKVPAVIPANAAFRQGASPDAPLYLLLHGYLQSGPSLARKLVSALPADACVLSLSAPFPVPERKGDAWRLGYTWYFYDPSRATYLVDMDVPCGFVRSVLQQLGLFERETVIVGYSQGGYLAPAVARALPRVSRVIGLSCQFLPEQTESLAPLPFRIDAIHGDADAIVDPVRARALHDDLLKGGAKGEFRLLPGVGHAIDDRMRLALAELLAAEDGRSEGPGDGAAQRVS